MVLRARDGGWDLLWRNYREKEPPAGATVDNPGGPGVEDMPSYLLTHSDLRRLLYLRQDAWEEWEAHAAEQAFYDRGGSIPERRNTPNVNVMAAWLREQEQLASSGFRHCDDALPQGFSIVVLDGRKIAVSGMVTVGSSRKMLLASGYAGRLPASD